ncbi:hypothetical protein GVN16_18460 [Emticicia sp. CRIBPO]|uniref:hypothetical protein n=1 Tax=Emticicia sp. CRIBPO TaxID=2683258 RepID=UPI0014121873|nr:hypothetical protein [Emticicia sp. CRIBPO]NBA87758.1 hypothetical protein [Emticicia sp. CRIBPO]
MKKYLIILLLISGGLRAQQVTVNVSVAPPMTPYLLDNIFKTGKFSIQIKNNTRETIQLKLTGSIAGDNGLWLKTKPNYHPPKPIILNPNEIRILKNWQELQDFLDGNNVDYSEIDPQTIARNGFPEGTYNICVKALDYLTNTPLSFEEPLGCSNAIHVRYTEPPVILSPVCDEEVHGSNLIFRWSGVVGAATKVTYSLKIVELPFPEADPNVFIDAVEVPFFEQKELNINNLVYNASLPKLKPGKSYAIRIKATDPQHKLIFLNEGKSAVCKFMVTDLPHESH